MSGGRCHQRNPGLSGERGDDLGGGRSVTSLDQEIWSTARALYRLKELALVIMARETRILFSL